jgi:hypothetical protein
MDRKINGRGLQKLSQEKKTQGHAQSKQFHARNIFADLYFFILFYTAFLSFIQTSD